MSKHYNEKSFEEIVSTLPKLRWEGRPGWREEAKCKEMPTELFFGLNVRKSAKTICFDCPVRMDCLEFAIVNNIEDGLYGGMLTDERKKITVDDLYK